MHEDANSRKHAQAHPVEVGDKKGRELSNVGGYGWRGPCLFVTHLASQDLQ